jgi:hypothetical protein
MIKLITSYKFFLWFMRIVPIPVMAGCLYMAIDSYHRALIDLTHDVELALLIGMFGGTFALAYFLVAWTCGWKKDKEGEK